jgi:hypothetical protein
MVIKYNNIFHSKAVQKVTQIVKFGLKIDHLATLLVLTKNKSASEKETSFAQKTGHVKDMFSQ